MRFKIDCARLINGKKFTVFALFYFVFGGNFQVQAPPPGGWGYIITKYTSFSLLLNAA